MVVGQTVGGQTVNSEEDKETSVVSSGGRFIIKVSTPTEQRTERTSNKPPVRK